MSVFTPVVAQSRGFLCHCAVKAAVELGLDALLQFPTTLQALADTLGTGTHRLRALLDVLAAEGVVARTDEGDERTYAWTSLAPLIAAGDPLPWGGGWLALSTVIRGDRPLELEAIQAGRASPEAMAYQQTLLAQGRPMADAVWRRWPVAGVRLLDLGSGLGAYAQAFVAAYPHATAVLADRPDVLEQAHQVWTANEPRVTTCPGNFLDTLPELAQRPFDVIVASNVAHLFTPEECQHLVGLAAGALAPGGVLVLVDLDMADDRSGPLASLYFSLNMAIYTSTGRLYAASEMAQWLQGAGLHNVAWDTLSEFPETLAVVGRSRIA